MRSKLIAVLLLLAIAFECFFLPRIFLKWNESIASVLSGVLVSLTNVQRTENNLSTLAINTLLEQAAKLKAEDMAQKNYFAHMSPDGKDLTYFLNQVGYDYKYAGENLALNFSESSDVINSWMQSPDHRKNILKNRYTEIGIGTASTTINGKERVFVVQFFGAPNN